MTDTSASQENNDVVAELSRLQLWVIALGLVSMGVGMTVSFVVASPLIREGGLNELQVAGIMTLSAFFYAFLTPFWGRLANRYGRKRMMVFALSMMALTNTGFILAIDATLKGALGGLSAFLTLAAVRLAFGILSPGLQPAAMSSMTDATNASNRAAGMGFFGAAMSVGSIVGPAGAAVLANFGALAPLWGAVVFAALSALFILIVLPDDRGATSGRARPSPLNVRDPRIFMFLVFLVSYFVAVACIQQTLAFLIVDRFELGRADAVAAAGYAFGAMALAMVITQTFYVNRLKPSPNVMLSRGLFLVALGYALAVIPAPFIALCGAFAIVGIGAALVVPAVNALGTLAVDQGEQGSAAALLAAAPPAGFVIGPLLGGVLYMASPNLPLIVSAVGVAALLIVAKIKFGVKLV